jgi:acyl-CoA thioesterase-1
MNSGISGFLLSLLLTVVPAHNHTAFAANITPQSILVLGDSLSGAWGIDTGEGWVALLQQQITQKGYDYRVINASVSGDTTRTGLTRIETALAQHRPAIVIVALGGNDGLRGLALSETENSLARIIEHAQQSQARVLLSGVRLPPNYGTVYTDKFAAVYRGLSERYGIPLVPRMLDQVAEHRELMQEDGIHPTAEAQPQIMLNVWAGLEPMLKTAGASKE